MYEVVYENECFWVSKNGEIIYELGGYIEPVTCEILIQEILDES